MIISYKEWPIENSLPMKYALLLLNEQLFGNTLLYVFFKDEYLRISNLQKYK